MARRVVIVGIHRGNQEVDEMEVCQETGRAGRQGKDLKGDAYILLPKSKFYELREKYKKMPPIISRMMPIDDEGIDNLIFHAVSEVAEENVIDELSLAQWHSRSLAAYQGAGMDLEDSKKIFELLEKICAVKKKDDIYVATGLGKVSSLMYMNPYDIFSWYMNFNKIFKESKHNDDVAIAWALSNTRLYDNGYTSNDDNDGAVAFNVRCKRIGLEIFDSKCAAGCMFMALLGHAEFGTLVMDRQRMESIRMDSERVLQSIAMIDKFYARWVKSRFFERLKIRISYSVPKYLVNLCMLTSIGTVRSQVLWRGGIKSLEDMIERRETSIRLLGGDERAAKIYEEAISTKEF